MFGMLQNIRVLTTLVFLGGFNFVFQILVCVVNLVFVWIILLFPLEINIQLTLIRSFCSFLPSLYELSLKKKEKNHCHLVFVCCISDCFVPICRLSISWNFFFFWHCTFNLKCFLYLLDINVLPFLIGLYKFAFFFLLYFL